MVCVKIDVNMCGLAGVETRVRELVFDIDWCSWWRHQMETFSALLALCAGNSPVAGEFRHKGQRCGNLMFSLICRWTNGWVNNWYTGDLRCHGTHYDVTVMCQPHRMGRQQHLHLKQIWMDRWMEASASSCMCPHHDAQHLVAGVQVVLWSIIYHADDDPIPEQIIATHFIGKCQTNTDQYTFYGLCSVKCK